MSSSVKTGTRESVKYKLDSVTDGTREVLQGEVNSVKNTTINIWLIDGVY